MAKKELSYKEAITEIEEIIAKIENDELDVDQLSVNVKRVAELIKFCKNKLHKTSAELDNLLESMESVD